jgi:WD40 repeat protein
MKLALLALGLLGIVVAGWLAFTPPQLRLRTIIEPPTEFQHDNALIQGFSPDGSLLVIEHDRYGPGVSLIVREVSSGRIAKSVRATDIIQGANDETVLTSRHSFFQEFSPDGSLLALGLQEGDVVKVYDTLQWREKASLDQALVVSCEFFPDGNTLLVMTARGFTVWDLLTGQRLATMEDWCQAENTQCFISPDGRALMAVELRDPNRKGDQFLWRIGTWDSATWTLQRQIQRDHPHHCDFKIAPSGQTLATVSDEGLAQIQDIESGTVLNSVELPDTNVPHGISSRSRDGQFILIEGGEFTFWTWDIRKPEARAITADVAEWCNPMDLSRNGCWIASCCATVSSFDRWRYGLPTPFRTWALWWFGKPLGRSTTLRVQEVATGLQVGATTIKSSWVASLVWSPNGSLLAASDNKCRVYLYDLHGNDR